MIYLSMLCLKVVRSCVDFTVECVFVSRRKSYVSLKTSEDYAKFEKTSAPVTVLSVLGSGGFGKVYKCWSRGNGEVAVKVPEKYRTADYLEASLLVKLLQSGVDFERVHIIRCLGFLGVSGSPCPVFECLQTDLRKFLNNVGVLNIHQVRALGIQLFKAIQCLKGFGFLHGDIKPSNIMVSGIVEGILRVKLIDLGGFAAEDRPEGQKLVSTTEYRCPELILRLPASYPVDMWAVTLVLVEAYMGDRLFPADSDWDMMHFIRDLVGLDNCFRAGAHAHKFLRKTELELLDHPAPSTSCPIRKIENLNNEVYNKDFSYQFDARHFVDSVEKALHPNPQRRLTVEEAFREDFFTLSHLEYEVSKEHLTMASRVVAALS